ncbi:PRC-barrel domain-containing protein [Afifella pfennigii]|uniref:PRC-barrel domain-containing protein n=1 Tax=Afifella pfennigii TaxID=209897 RepID=UPI000478F8BF|nr:PRC-barrel domain-containing protein [Afifella pfennigii]
MIRSLMASTAIAALLTTGAMAQTQPAENTQQQQQMQAQDTTAQGGVKVMTRADASEDLASQWMGQRVYSSASPDAETVGDVNDLVLDENGDVTAAIIGVGGFLSLGERDVAIPYQEFQVTEDQGGELRLVLNTTREALENAPAFEQGEGQRIYSQMQDGQADENRTAMDTASEPQGDAERQMAQKDAAQTDATATDAGQENVAFLQSQDDETRISEWLGREVYSSTAKRMVPGAGGAATDATGTANIGTANTGQTATGQGMTDEATTETAGTEAARADGQVAFDQQISVGEVDDIILSDSGTVQEIVIDVGGFLGVGEKPVAVPFDRVELVERPDSEETRLTVPMTRAELEAAQPFDASLYEADRLASTGMDDDRTAETAMTGQSGEAATAEGGATTAQKQPQADPAGKSDMAAKTAGSGAMQGGQASGTSADRLLGATVYGSAEESVGEIGDVIVSRQGDVRAVIIDVGGFLGIGEKPVAVEYDRLNVQKDVNGETRYSISASEDELDQAPAYEDAR